MKMLILGLAGVVAILALAGGYRAWRQQQAAELLAIRTQNGIDEAGYVRIGGIDQYVSVRGEDRADPVLVIAHGGPGSSMIPLIYEALRPWERHFTVVQWDQRGAGRTYARGGPRGQGEVSLDRISRDGIEVVEHALSRTGQRKAVLLGASWGSIVGVDMARKRPDLFAAYVGAGQVVDMERNEAVGYAALLERIKAAGDSRSEAALRRIAPPPYADLKEVIAERRILMRFPPTSERGLLGRLMVRLAFAPRTSLREAWATLAGQMFSLRALAEPLKSYRDPQDIPTFDVPVLFIQGTDDIQTPTSLVEDYYAAIRAPSKQLVLLSGGGHMAMMGMPDAFLDALRTHLPQGA